MVKGWDVVRTVPGLDPNGDKKLKKIKKYLPIKGIRNRLVYFLADC